MKFAKAEHPDEARFDITAMVDIVLLLIIFFSFTAQFGRTLLAPVDLPREKGAPVPTAASHAVVIDLTSKGDTIVMGKQVDSQWLLQALARDIRTAGGPEKLDVLVRADRRCAASHLNNLAASLTSQGIRNWKLATSEAAP